MQETELPLPVACQASTRGDLIRPERARRAPTASATDWTRNPGETLRILSDAMTYEDLLALVRRFDGKTLETITGKRFRGGIYRDCAFFTPESSGYGQSDGRAAAERFVARYNAIGSLRPGDYSGVTRNASYCVALIRADTD